MVIGGIALVVVGACGGAAGVLAAKWPAADLSALECAAVPAVVLTEVSEQPLHSAVQLVAAVHPPRTKEVFAPGGQPAGGGESATSFQLAPSAIGTPFGPALAATQTAAPNQPATEPSVEGAPDQPVPADLETQRLLVTVQKKQVGDPVAPGDVVAEVSGRPVFAVPPGLPFYRNLAVGAKGADVAALRQYLEQAGHLTAGQGSEFNARILAGLRSLYQAGGYELPLADGVNQGFVLDEFAEVAAQPVPVVKAAAVGALVGDGTPLVEVVIGEPWASARASILDAEALQEGSEVSVTANEAEPLASTVQSVSEYQADGNPGYDLVIPLTIEWYEAAGGVDRVTVAPVGEVPVGPAVPLTAVREDANVTYVSAETAEGAKAANAGQKTDQAGGCADAGQAGRSERVPVEVIGQSGGWALIAPNDALPIGRRVVVSGASGSAK
jgi:hypothetical protein